MLTKVVVIVCGKALTQPAIVFMFFISNKTFFYPNSKNATAILFKINFKT